jgi:hypothetical protein
MVERLRQEREATGFYPTELDEIFEAERGGDIDAWIERINGRPMRSDATIDVRTTVHLEGWMLSPSVMPDAETTARYLLLQNDKSGETYAAQVHQYWPRQDVAQARHNLDSAYTMNSGFGSLFSVSKVPPGTYRLGCGLKNSTKSAFAWSDYRIQLMSGDRRRGVARDLKRRRRAAEARDA